MKKSDFKAIASRLLGWYRQNKRDLPWRHTRNPYFIWISEIMLQQTQVETVIPFYQRFISRFPTVKSLAAAPLEEVLKAWENMGYYGRARNLHSAAREIMERENGRMPGTYEDLIKLPGIGDYTASAILSFAFGNPLPAMDANVARVISRLACIREASGSREGTKRIREEISPLLPVKASSHFNQALMDMGTAVCTPRKPGCTSCPLNPFCISHKQGIQDQIPTRKQRPPLPHREMVAALINDDNGRILVVRRPLNGLLGGLWKLPGGERAPEETLERALKRNVKKELGIGIRVHGYLTSVKHAYTHFRITVYAYRCTLLKGGPSPEGLQAWQWATPKDIKDLPFSRVDRKILEMK